MWLIFFFICLASVHAKRFVLLDPDDSDLEKSATNITDGDVRSRSLKMAKFRKWLKYDVDCEFISRQDLEVKISNMRCPVESEVERETTTTTKKPKSLFFKRKRKPIVKADESLFSHENKETVVRAIVGNNKMHDIDWTPVSPPDLQLVGGSMVTFKCNEENRKENRKKNEELEFIEWFVNGKRINPSWFDWRVSVSIDGKLGIWPIEEGDSGHFECLANGQLTASVTVNVIPISKVLVDGLINYLFVCAVFAVATISMGCLLGNRNQEKKEIEVDRMEEFLAENVFKTDQIAKEKVAGIIEKQDLVDERQLIENKAKSNRSTIMILLQNPTIQNQNLKTENENPKVSNKTTLSDDGNTKATTTATTEGTTGTTSGTTATTTTTTTNETEVVTTVTKTDEEDVNNVNVEANDDPDEEEEEEGDDVAPGTASKGSTTTSNASKGTNKGKKKTSKGTKPKKKKDAGKGKKTTKTSKAKGGGKGTKNTKKTTKSKPTKKKK